MLYLLVLLFGHGGVYFSVLQYIPQLTIWLQVVSWITENDNGEGLASFFCSAWSLRQRENQMVFEGNTSHPMEAFEEAISIHANFLSISKIRLTPNAPHWNCVWEPPQAKFVKINVDGTMFYDLAKAEIDIIVINSRGDAVFAISIAERKVA